MSREDRASDFDAFLRDLWSDLDRGHALPVDQYVARYPAIAERVETEYAALVADSATGVVGDAECVDVAPVREERTIGRYEILRLLGRGGMGEVYLAWDPELRRKVVLKLSRLLGRDSKSIERMKREAQIASRVAHEGICSVLDVMLADEGVVIVLPHIQGETLAARLARARARAKADTPATFPSISLADRSADSEPGSAGTSVGADARGERQGDLRHLLRFMEDVAAAVHSMHESGVVHRDLKPANIMIRGDGQPVVLDFGLAVDQTSRALRLTAPGEVLGTPLYMAPEQVEGRLDRIDRRTDVHALGAILFELLTLRSPFDAPTKQAVLRRICSQDPPAPRSMNARVPADLDAVCLKALALEPERRYATAADLAEDLRNVRTLQPTIARPLSPAARLMRRVRRAPWTWSFALAALLAVSAGTIIVRRLHQTVTFLHAFNELMSASLQGHQPSAEVMNLLEERLDARAIQAFRANPADPRIRQVLFASVPEWTRGARETIHMVQPRAALATPRPLFEFATWQKPSIPHELVLERESGAPVDGFPVTIDAGIGSTRFELPEGSELEPGTYRWSVRSPTSAASWVEFRVATREELEHVSYPTPTGSPDIDRLVRAAILLQEGFAQDVAVLLDEDAAEDTSLETEAWRLLLRARAASRLQDLPALLAADDALEGVLERLER